MNWENEGNLMKLNGGIVAAAAMTQMFFRDEGGCEIGFNMWLFVKLVCKINIRRSGVFDLKTEIAGDFNKCVLK